MRRKTVTVDELDGSKREMRTLMLERDLLSAALTKVYEAESDGQITREERELIARKYSSQIREFEAKLRDKELIVEVGRAREAEGRARLALQGEDPEHRVAAGPGQGEAPADEAGGQARAQAEAQAGAAQVTSVTPSIAQTEDLERVVERKAPVKKDDTEGEKRVKALRDEVMDALAELEQIDTRKENETA